jgi:hypothetical protein
MNHSLEKCYELLGLKPGATREELKAAYRDLGEFGIQTDLHMTRVYKRERKSV